MRIDPAHEIQTVYTQHQVSNKCNNLLTLVDSDFVRDLKQRTDYLIFHDMLHNGYIV